MLLTEIEKEIVAWFIGENWDDFFSQAQEFTNITTLLRLAEKLGLEDKISDN